MRAVAIAEISSVYFNVKLKSENMEQYLLQDYVSFMKYCIHGYGLEMNINMISDHQYLFVSPEGVVPVDWVQGQPVLILPEFRQPLLSSCLGSMFYNLASAHKRNA